MPIDAHFLRPAPTENHTCPAPLDGIEVRRWQVIDL
jgi:hypothetical protein